MSEPFPEERRDFVSPQDVIKALRDLPSGSVDMIYGDPDYGVGINYNGKIYENIKNTDKSWDNYMEWYIKLAKECMRVLSPQGNLFMMNYPRQNAYLRARYLDDAAFAVWDYVWVYPANVGHSPRHFTTAHRSILHATKSKHNKFYKEQVVQPYKNPTDSRIRQKIKAGDKGRMPYSWFECNLVKNTDFNKTIHACQIPILLYDLLLKASTKKGDVVLILFGGSGSEVAHTEKEGRIFFTCEIHPEYHKMIKTRLKGGGKIPKGYRLSEVMEKKKKNIPQVVNDSREFKTVVEEKLKNAGYSRVSPLTFKEKCRGGRPIYTKRLVVGKTPYGNPRHIDFVLYHPKKWGRSKNWPHCLALRCIWQSTSGSADQKYLFEVSAIRKGEIKTAILLAGGGYSKGSEKWLRDEVKEGGKLVAVYNLEEFKRFMKKNSA